MENIADYIPKIKDAFYKEFRADKEVTKLYAKARDGTADYTDAHNFAVKTSELMNKVIEQKLPPDLQKQAEESALTFVQEVTGVNFNTVASYAQTVQGALNKKAGIGLKALKAKQDVEKTSGLATVLSQAEENVFSSIREQLVLIAQSVVDDTIRTNAEMHENVGFSPTIVREYEGPHRQHTNHKDGGDMTDCEWCQNLAGSYKLSELSQGDDVWKRHEGCRCTITYMPDKDTNNNMTASGNGFHRW